MRVTSSFSDYQPIRYVGRVPIYATTIITALFAVGVLVSIVLLSARLPIFSLSFTPAKFLSGSLWQPFTYAFIERPSFFTIMGIFAFYSWSLEVEKFIGRARFLGFFGLLLLVQPVVCLFWHWVFGAPASAVGGYHLAAAALVGFATIYPNIEYLGWVLLKWFAFACLAIGSVMYFPEHDWVGLSLLWITCGAAFGYIRLVQRGTSFDLPDFRGLFRRKPKFSVVRDPTRPSPLSRREEDTVGAIDPLLDKIAKSGLASLTAPEREQLEKARETLIKRGPTAP